jgi:hypothetical protein
VRAALSWIALFGLACGEPEPEATCAQSTVAALSTCVTAYGDRLAACHADGTGDCPADDADLLAALDALGTAVNAACGTEPFGALQTPAVDGRLRAACASEAASLGWRAFGGPHSAVYGDAGDTTRTCLADAHAAAQAFMTADAAALADCLDGSCAEADLQARRDRLAAEAVSTIDASCLNLASVAALDSTQFVDAAALQTDCLVAAAHPDSSVLPLDCGPGNAEIDPPRGEWSEVLPGDEWGTLCGDGSEFAFWIRPAPEGQPLDRVVVALQGGGVCLFAEDCGPRFGFAPELFSARDPSDQPLPIAIASDDPDVSAFADWTMIYVPYCTQDVFAGGGVTEDFGDVRVERYGAVNLRASVRILRDYLWREMDAEGGDGFRPDAVQALFGGFSAGGYGTLYNYHWMLDDLQWPQTTAFPDAGLAVDNGELLGVGSLGAVKIPAWGMQPLLPPYCFEGPCSGGQTLLEAASPRLQQVPNQNILMLSNQRDRTQAGDAFFPDEASFLNGMRQMYCDTRDLPGVYWYLTSVSDVSTHVITLQQDLWTGAVDGEILNDFLLTAVEAPDDLRSRVEEGDFVEVLPGVEPFPCALE